ncbi:MAG: redoxin domain-containing protein [Patescibacteria group bacterium]
MKKFSIFIAVAAIALLGGMYYFGGRNIQSNNIGGQKTSAGSLDGLVGKPVLGFSLTDREGKIYSSENLKGKNYVLFFNEGLMCYPACWSQMAEFGKDERFNKEDLLAFSVVVDSKSQWQSAISKMPELARTKVLFDSGAIVSRKFNVLTVNSSMHYGSMPGHTYIVVDKSGVVRYVYDDPTMAINNDMLFIKINSF